MSEITVTLDRSEALALVHSAGFADMALERLGGRSLLPPGTSPREVATQKLTSALERSVIADGFEALGVEPNRHVQRTWRP